MKNEKDFNFNIQKGNLKIKQVYFVFYFKLLIALLRIAFVKLIILKNSRKINNYFSQIHLGIQVSGQGFQEINILNNTFNSEPDEVLINGVQSQCKKTCSL